MYGGFCGFLRGLESFKSTGENWLEDYIVWYAKLHIYFTLYQLLCWYFYN